MEYGILVAQAFDTDNDTGVFQVVGTVSSVDEARELANDYLRNGPENGAVAPDQFMIHRRGPNGFYSRWEPLTL